MDNLPVELIEYIFSLSCTDDGETGRSLGRTCHLFRRIVDPYQWISLAFRSLAKLHQFITLMEERRHVEDDNPVRRTVKHIFIKVDYKSIDLGEEGKGAERLFRSLFALSSQSLISLVCYHEEPSSMLEYFAVRALASTISTNSFPRLQDLTGSALMFHTIPSLREEKNVMDVRRLHIHDWQPAFSRRLFQLIMAKFTNVTHLRITGRSSSPLLFWLMLHNDLDAMWKSTEKKNPGILEDAKQDLIPATLKYISYQPDVAILDLLEIQQRYDKLFSEYCRNPRLFKILPSGRYEYKEMYQDWLDCLNSEDGAHKIYTEYVLG